jgi:hypothetical protein
MFVQRSLLPALLCVSLSAAAVAADYPASLRGRWQRRRRAASTIGG